MEPAPVDRLLAWFRTNARDLPWRRPDAGPWAVLVSEVMLQQTQVRRVLPTFEAWLHRWPGAADLAAEPAGEAVRAWGRLGYPRRALRLHATARILVERHGGHVPADLDQLLALPGVGAYTARAVCAFGFGLRQPVVDTNVRRVLARFAGTDRTPELQVAEGLLPPQPGRAALVSAALMEVGALLCRPGSPNCRECPLATGCQWLQRGAGADPAPHRRRQRYSGTDRQARGQLLAVLRDAAEPAGGRELAAAWPDAEQRARALSSLVADGLAVPRAGGFTLPG